jgi:hypothetical protein
LGLPVVDSSAEVVHKIGGKTLLELAEKLYRQTPVAWGRYFKDKQSVGGVHYNPATENAPLAAKNIRLIPIAQQTDRVNKGSREGTADAKKNVEALFAAFSPEFLAQHSAEFYYYLDVEGSPNPSLSSAYYQGWSATIVSASRAASNNNVTLLPGLYCNLDKATWKALADATSHGAPCHSAWLARWFTNDQVCAALRPWNKQKEMPDPKPNCPVHLWQYAQECHGGDGFDMDMTNPFLDLNAYLSKLIPTA